MHAVAWRAPSLLAFSVHCTGGSVSPSSFSSILHHVHGFTPSRRRTNPFCASGASSASVAWGAIGRGADYGDVAMRWSALVDMATHSDRLAHSFLVDSLTFWAFQGWLVPDDMCVRSAACLFVATLCVCTREVAC
jgi:hypothetical protein